MAPTVCASAIGNYEAKERHDLDHGKSSEIQWRDGSGKGRVKLLKACRPRPDFELVVPQRPSP